ncbi:5-(carboxyamino)imidazole ribonucleotide mutase, partial [bacterium]
MDKPLVGIVMGSDSDLKTMAYAAKKLEDLGISYEITISSAHRSLNKTLEYARTAEERGIEVLIVAAGMAAHLAGVIAGEVTLPVIGVPMSGSELCGLDSLYSIVQMPSGVPVATVAIGKAGAVNSAILAAQILALKYSDIKEKLVNLKKDMREGVVQKDKKL